MTELTDAAERLMRAVDRLEAAAFARAAALDRVQEEHAALEAMSEDVSHRLDGTIDRLRAVLEG